MKIIKLIIGMKYHLLKCLFNDNAVENYSKSDHLLKKSDQLLIKFRMMNESKIAFDRKGCSLVELG